MKAQDMALLVVNTHGPTSCFLLSDPPSGLHGNQGPLIVPRNRPVIAMKSTCRPSGTCRSGFSLSNPTAKILPHHPMATALPRCVVLCALLLLSGFLTVFLYDLVSNGFETRCPLVATSNSAYAFNRCNKKIKDNNQTGEWGTEKSTNSEFFL